MSNLPTLTLPDGTTHIVAPDDSGQLEHWDQLEIQALLMAFSDVIADLFGEGVFAKCVELAGVYHAALKDQERSDASAEQVADLELDGQMKLTD